MLQVVVVEEAGEVFEAHILASLAPTTEHLILIGDPEQLRPKPQLYTLQVRGSVADAGVVASEEFRMMFCIQPWPPVLPLC